MNQHAESKFYVIEFIDLPNTNFDKYVCIPSSWIILRETVDGVVIVKFPTEEISAVKKRARREETHSENWTIFLADVKYGTNSYKDAEDFIKILNKISTQTQNDKENGKLVETDKEINTSQLTMDINKPSTSKSVLTDKTKAKQLQFTSFEKDTQENKDTMIENGRSASKFKRYFTRQSRQMSSSSDAVDLLHEAVQETSKKFYDYIEKSTLAEDGQKIKSLQNQSVESINGSRSLMISRQIFDKRFLEILKELHSECEKQRMIFDDLSRLYLQHCTEIKQMIDLVVKVNNLDIDDSDVSVKNVPTVVVKEKKNINNEVNNQEINKGSKETRKAERKEDDDSDDKIEVDKVIQEVKDENKNETQRKIRGQARKFTLPPEYDASDSRWTLKYRKKKKGLVELVPHSGVYVDSFRLAHCKRLSKDSKTLARMLLLEIFTTNALSICSLTGKRANAFDFDDTDVRPGLDENARTVLLNYVEQYAIDNNWVQLDIQLILTSLRNKIQEMRNKNR